MVLQQESIVTVNPISDVIKATILAAFTFLTALSLRDSITKTIEAFVPSNAKEKLIMVYFTTLLILFITLLLAYLWQNSTKK